ncbi:alcohol dehydrogenase [Microbacterium sp. CH12i]|nr:alcohol dehydrogenase [Microbacterium sp. CH12i]
MRAAVINAIGSAFEIEEVEIAEPQGSEVLVDVRAVGLCHSDLHFAQADVGMPLPLVLGHEVAGVVVAVGEDVTGLVPGDHVVGSLIQSCGTCPRCTAGAPFQCLNPFATLRGPDEPSRLTRDGQPVFGAFGLGGFAERALVHENQLAKVDTAVPFAEASILGCGVLTGVGAVLNGAGVKEGDTVAVIGLGGVGLNVLSGARLAGASRIIGVDVNDEKLALAASFGATDTVNGADSDAVAAVLELTGGVDHAFEVIGMKQTSEQAIAMLGVGGTAHLIGIHKPDRPIEIDVNTLLAPQRGIRGVYMGSSDLHRDVPRYAKLFLDGELNLSDLISREINIDQINDAYEELKNGAIARSVITSF